MRPVRCFPVRNLGHGFEVDFIEECGGTTKILCSNEADALAIADAPLLVAMEMKRKVCNPSLAKRCVDASAKYGVDRRSLTIRMIMALQSRSAKSNPWC